MLITQFNKQTSLALRKSNTVKGTHCLDMHMRYDVMTDVPPWSILKRRFPRKCILDALQKSFEYLLYYSEINFWCFFVNFLTWNLRLMHILWLQSVSLKCLHHVYNVGERSWSADRVSKLCFKNTENTCNRINKWLGLINILTNDRDHYTSQNKE